MITWLPQKQFRQRANHVRRWLSRASLARLFRSNIGEVTDVCNRVAAGDLEARILRASNKTQFSRMCAAINKALDTSDAFVREAAAAMENCSRDRFHRPILLRGLQGSYQQSARVINTAAALMKTDSENLSFVATQAAETANNVQAVAAACEELNATTTEISAQMQEAAENARNVTRQLAEMTDTFERLQAAVVKIDGVVSLLSTVAIQTKLLGLNAAIEAAHVGELGSGFAVVAQEVKKLSDDTHLASEEIGLELHEIKNRTSEAANTLQAISASIHKVSTSNNAIDISVREQVKAASSISSSIVSVSEKSEEIALRIKTSRAAA